MEKHRGGAGSASHESVEDIVSRVRDRVLEAHAPTVLKARTETGKRSQLLALVTQQLVGDGLGLPRLSREALAEHVVQELVGYGPIDPLVLDDQVSEVMVNGPGEVYVERDGQVVLTSVSFDSEEQLTDVIVRMVAPLGRRVDRSSPYVDARLPDGSRINAVLPPLSLNGPVLTIRKFPQRWTGLGDLVRLGSLSADMAAFLEQLVHCRGNLLMSGGTSSGKTTTLNVICHLVPAVERLITIEDSAELRLNGRHVVRLETRPPNMEGTGAVELRDLVRNALRMRPDRLIIGEVRGPEAFDLVQSMNTGHPGSMATVHANSCADALKRLEGMVLMAGSGLPLAVVRQHLGTAIDVIIHHTRVKGGGRRITEIAVMNRPDDGQLNLIPVFQDLSWGRSPRPEFTATGRLPRWLQDRMEGSEDGPGTGGT
jgi:pilus assembly protein CpaF